MPHSGGGGSHGGGHHSGGHHGGSSGSSPSLRKKPFPGSRRFRYYNRRGVPIYLYGKEAPKPQSKKSFVISMIFMTPFAFAGIFMIGMVINMLLPPKPLKPEYVSPETRIMDFAGFIENERELEETLEDFEELTGVSPCIATVFDSVWMNNYDSLESFAYELYVDNFDDEQHLLIVYSEPESADKDSFVSWSWESMLGDDIYPVLSDAKFDKMGKELQKYLCRDEMSVEKAFERTFSESTEYVMKRTAGKTEICAILFFMLFWYSFVGFFIYILISQFVKSRRKYEEVPFGGDLPHMSDTYPVPDSRRYDTANERYNEFMSSGESTFEDKY